MKRWLMFMIAIAFLLALTACGNGGNGDTADPPTDSGGDTGEETDNVQEDEGTPPGGEGAGEEDAEGNEGEEGELQLITVELMNSDGDAVGTAELSEEDNGVNVALDLEGLESGFKGLHFHEMGQCEAPDFESAGEHFNPTNASHGMEHPEGPHAGDLPNLEVEDDGTVSQELLAEHVTLTSGEENSLLKEGGTALVIHASEDDGETQPSGDSGERVACGVVTTE